MNNPYVKTDWKDKITDIITGDLIQPGTRFTATRANNIEDGIFNLYNMFIAMSKEMDKLRVQLEMVGRAPTNNGIFFDNLNGDAPKALAMDVDFAIAQNSLVAGTTTIPLDVVNFAVGEQITIYDDTTQEELHITAVGGDSITVSATTNAYKKGAVITRTSAIKDTANAELTFGKWGTYSIEIGEVN